MHLEVNDHDLCNMLVVHALTKVAHLPAEAQSKFKNAATVGAPGDRIVESAEVLYAYYDLLNLADKEILASCFACGAKNGWTMLSGNKRAERVVGMVMKDHGVVSPLCPCPTDAERPDPQAHRRDGLDWRNPPPPPPAEPAPAPAA